MNKFFKQLFCWHHVIYCYPIDFFGDKVSDCDRAEYRVVFSSPFSLFGKREIRFRCNRCGAKYWGGVDILLREKYALSTQRK